jgi:hypothetical protein
VKTTKVSHIFWLLFPYVSFSIHFDKKWVGLHFGRFFRKLIWSPCQGFKSSADMYVIRDLKGDV